MLTPIRTSLLLLSSAAFFAFPLFASAQTPYTDVPMSSPVYAAVEYLKSKGVLQEAPTFKPNDKLTRAQAVKILVVPLVSADQLENIITTSFSDIAPSAWYLPYAEAARLMGIVDSAATFRPDAVVTKAGFMKMLLASKKIDYKVSFSDIALPLSSDVANVSEWYYPVLRYGLASSMTAVGKDGMLSPSRDLTRGDMAVLAYRLDMYLAGRRMQALLSQTEVEIGNVLQMLSTKDVQQAEYASARSLLTARGALVMRPDEAIVKGAVKVSEGFRSLVLAYKAGVSGDLDGVLKYAKDAYALADKAKTFSPDLSTLTGPMQKIAKDMADEARAAKNAL